MPDTLAEVLAIEGLWWVVTGATLAGLVRGFSGFGTAMIFLPVAGQFVPPVWALTAMFCMDAFGPLPAVPRALRDGYPTDVLRLFVGMLVMLPIGIWVLSALPAEIFRYAVSLLTMVLLVLLMAGIRYRGKVTPPLIFGTGGLGGFLGGSMGVAGPPVIMLYMASTHPAKVIRANITLYLLLTDFALLTLFWLNGLLKATPVYLGLGLVVPYLLANLVGTAMFNPNKEATYRKVAYAIIAASALSGLPLWD